MFGFLVLPVWWMCRGGYGVLLADSDLPSQDTRRLRILECTSGAPQLLAKMNASGNFCCFFSRESVQGIQVEGKLTLTMPWAWRP